MPPSPARSRRRNRAVRREPGWPRTCSRGSPMPSRSSTRARSYVLVLTGLAAACQVGEPALDDGPPEDAGDLDLAGIERVACATPSPDGEELDAVERLDAWDSVLQARTIPDGSAGPTLVRVAFHVIRSE